MTRSPQSFDVNGVDLGPGQMLLEASAGTGKTWSLTTIAARALLEGRLDDIAELLMVTFTKAATDDLRTRLRQRLQETLAVAIGGEVPAGDDFLATVPARASESGRRRLRRALREFDRARIHTIHSYCARLLQETAFEAGLSLELGEPTDAAPLRRTALEDAWRELVVEGPAWLVTVAALQGWNPDGLADLVDARARHRRLDIRPHAVPLLEVARRFESALVRVQDEVDPAEVAAALAALLENPIEVLTKEGVAASGASLVRSLRALAASTPQSPPDPMVWVAMGLQLPTALRTQWRKKHLVGRPWTAPLDELHAALCEVRPALRTAVLEATERRLQRNKSREEVLDYDDLIGRVRTALDHPVRRAALVGLAQASTRLACIDEFQDTDVDQWEIFRTLFGPPCTLVLVGDPKQAIYSFRGADVFAYLDARTQVQASGGQEFGLERNRRSHPDLVRAVKTLFGRGTAAFAADGIEHADVQAHCGPAERALEGDAGPAFRLEPVCVTSSGATSGKVSKARVEREVIARTVQEIRRLLGEPIVLPGRDGPVRLAPGHLTVLTRKHHQSAKVQRALRDAGIASVLGRSGDVHQSEAMEELGLLLDAALGARDPRTVRRAVATRLWGGNSVTLARLDEHDAEMGAVLEILEDLRRTWHRFGLLVAVDRFLQRQRVAERLMQEPDGDRLLTDLRHSLELVHRAAVEADFSPLGTVAWLWLEHARDHQHDEQRQLHLERDDDAVRIVTAHGSKGLEYEVVLVPFAWEGGTSKSPWSWHELVGGERVLVLHDGDLDSKAKERAWADRERLAEDLRLLYVALTRAKRRCVVFAADHFSDRSSNAGRSALFYLLHRASAQADEPLAAYVERCITALAGSKDAFTPPVPAWIEAEPWCGRLPSPGLQPTAPPHPVPKANFAARPLPADLAPRLVPWSMVSFTSLVRSSVPGPATVEVAGDADADANEASVAERADPPARTALLRTAPATGIFAFARGARAGVCLHEILERSDFDQPVDARQSKRIGRILERHGLQAVSAHAGALDPQAVAEELVRTASREPFPLGGFPLSDLRRAQRLDEWEFRAVLGRIRAPDLAEVFADHAGAPWDRSLPSRLRRLDDRAVEGLLGGFVDLVFEHQGRWFVVDWKSNHLGNEVDDYAPEAVQAAMLEHDYVLQLSLYCVAVHRFLRTRLRGYQYESHFGGAAYAFVRGWCGRPDRGWFAWRPPQILIESLDRAMMPRDAQGGRR